VRSVAQEGSGRQNGVVSLKSSSSCTFQLAKRDSSFSSPSLKKQYFNVLKTESFEQVVDETQQIRKPVKCKIQRKMRSSPYFISEENLNEHKQAQKGRGPGASWEHEKGKGKPFNGRGKPLGEYKKGIDRN